jgi:hypothetical protein
LIWTCAVGWLLIQRLRSGGHDRGGGDVAWHHIEWVFLRTAHSLHGGLGFECSRRTTRLSDAQGARPRQTSIHGRRVVKSISTAGEGRCGYLAARQRCAGGKPLVAHGCGKSERRHPVRCSARGEREERLCVARAPLQHLRAERSESMLARRTLSENPSCLPEHDTPPLQPIPPLSPACSIALRWDAEWRGAGRTTRVAPLSLQAEGPRRGRRTRGHATHLDVLNVPERQRAERVVVVESVQRATHVGQRVRLVAQLAQHALCASAQRQAEQRTCERSLAKTPTPTVRVRVRPSSQPNPTPPPPSRWSGGCSAERTHGRSPP